MQRWRKCELGVTRAVVDTNIWVSGILTPTGFSSQVLRLMADREFTPIFCAETEQELRETLRKPRLVRRMRFSFEAMNQTVAALLAFGEELTVREVTPVCRDPRDDVFVALAVAGKADYLVTRDDDLKGDEGVREHLAAAGVRLVTVREFVTVLDEAAANR